MSDGTAVSTWQGAESPHWRRSSSATGRIGGPIKPQVFWTEPCEAMFEYLAEHDPEALLEQLTSGALMPSALTFAAEWAGRSRAPGAPAILLGLLEHPSALVREGAVYGLELLINESGVLAALREHATETGERSPGVRDAAREALGR